MFKRIFTSEQLSLAFQIALLMNIFELLLEMFMHHYCPGNASLELIANNLNNVSIFMVCLVIVSQALFIFIQNHQKIVTQYKLAAIAVGLSIGIFFVWLLTIDSDLQENFIIFCSDASRTDHSYKIIATLLGIFILLILDFYQNLKQPKNIDDESVPQIIRSVFRLVIRKYLLIFIGMFGIINLHKLHKFACSLFNLSISTLWYDLSYLEIIIPVAWIIAIAYYVYNNYISKQREDHA